MGMCATLSLGLVLQAERMLAGQGLFRGGCSRHSYAQGCAGKDDVLLNRKIKIVFDVLASIFIVAHQIYADGVFTG